MKFYDLRLKGTQRHQIIENIMNSFYSMYLTMISIVQGVALGVLFYKTSDLFETAIFETHWMTVVFVLCAHLITFFLIILTWHSYFWLAAIARWVPLIWDSILFFVFGAFELALIRSLSFPWNFSWFYLFAAIGIIGGLQYMYNSIRLKDTENQLQKEYSDQHNKIWLGDLEDLGEHIQKYKYNRGVNLILISLAFLGFVALLNIVIVIKCIPVTFTRIVKLLLVLYILYIQIKLIKKHLNDQKETIEYLQCGELKRTSPSKKITFLWENSEDWHRGMAFTVLVYVLFLTMALTPNYCGP